MRSVVRLSVVMAVLAVSMLTGPGARANPYTVALGTNPGFTATRTAFQRDGCNPAFLGSPVNGTDGRVVDVAALAGLPIRVSWSGTKLVPDTTAYMSAAFVNGACVVTAAAPPSPGFADPGTWSFVVPAGTRWMLVEPRLVANVSFTISR